MPCNCPECRDERGDQLNVVTFGWESEFERNATPLAAELHRLGHCGSDYIHSWHCDCPTCEDEAFSFKVQHDSTVNGEVISKVFTSMPEAIEAANALQAAAVEVDAEPGWDAGLHVHVARPKSADRGAHFLAFALWEDAICALAQGRFPRMRSMNRNVGTDLRYRFGQTAAGYRRHLRDLCAIAVDDREDSRVRDLYVAGYEQDRHNNLNMNTRYKTWEFRVWNSTRSAWRIELACRIAVAWRDRDFIDGLLLAANEGDDRNADAFATVVSDWGGDEALTELVSRQVEYLPIAHRTPERFLVIA